MFDIPCESYAEQTTYMKRQALFSLKKKKKKKKKKKIFCYSFVWRLRVN